MMLTALLLSYSSELHRVEESAILDMAWSVIDDDLEYITTLT